MQSAGRCYYAVMEFSSKLPQFAGLITEEAPGELIEAVFTIVFLTGIIARRAVIFISVLPVSAA